MSAIKICQRCWNILVWLLLFFSQTLHAQSQKGVKMSETAVSRDEIEEVRFVGNSYFSSDLLAGIVNSRASDFSISRMILRYYQRGALRNPLTPASLIKALRRSEYNLGDETQYFDRTTAIADTQSLKLFYIQSGFHQAMVGFDFGFDSLRKKNVLTFRITENAPARFQSLTYYGLDSLPDEVLSRVNEVKTVRVRGIFNQGAISEQNDNILRILQNNGYYFAKYNTPNVLWDAERNTDSVTVVFETGKRQRIANIIYTDITANQPHVSLGTRQDFVAFGIGDWYSREKVLRSADNLLGLGTFDLVSIDTTLTESHQNDTSLSMRILTKVRKAQEVYLSTLTNKTALDNFWNVGFDASYSHKNIFGGAQSLNVYGQVLLQDINRFIEEKFNFGQAEYELQFGIKLAQPVLFKINEQRVGASLQTYYSYRTIPLGTLTSSLKIESFPINFTFPITLPSYTLFQMFYVDFNVEHQKPLNFASAIGDTISNVIDKTILPQVLQYANLYRASQSNFFTNTVLGLSVVGDHRDNPFTPSGGYFVNMSAEVDFGPSQYMRSQATAYYFYGMNSRSVLAGKIRLGHIFLFDKANSFVPVEKQFFAGGSNSVRSYSSRALHARFDDPYSLADVIGNATLFEGSAEWRFKFVSRARSTGFWDQQFARMGITGFFDFGNVYNSFFSDVQQPFLTSIALGCGVGFRYDTPVGPFRMDMATAIYDPTREVQQWIYERPFSVRWQIGIGHAF